MIGFGKGVDPEVGAIRRRGERRLYHGGLGAVPLGKEGIEKAFYLMCRRGRGTFAGICAAHAVEDGKERGVAVAFGEVGVLIQFADAADIGEGKKFHEPDRSFQ